MRLSDEALADHHGSRDLARDSGSCHEVHSHRPWSGRPNVPKADDKSSPRPSRHGAERSPRTVLLIRGRRTTRWPSPGPCGGMDKGAHPRDLPHRTAPACRTVRLQPHSPLSERDADLEPLAALLAAVGVHRHCSHLTTDASRYPGTAPLHSQCRAPGGCRLGAEIPLPAGLSAQRPRPVRRARRGPRWRRHTDRKAGAQVASTDRGAFGRTVDGVVAIENRLAYR